MNDYETTESESTEIEDRDVRALEQYLTVLDDVGRAKDADDLYLVVSQSGESYLVDARLGACECPDAEYRDPDGGCKHVRRVAFVTGERPIPDGVTIDEKLGEHVDAVATDGGTDIIDAGDEGEILDEEPDYTYHRETARQGGRQYVRCEECGREVLGRDPDRIYHRKGCSQADWRGR